jgi:hypothetical protein
MMDKLQKNEPTSANPPNHSGKTLDFFPAPAIIKVNDAGFAS